MTKKHFEVLAYRLAMTEPQNIDSSTVHMVWDDCCKAVAQAGGDCNPRFDRERFLAACKFDYWKTHKAPRGV